MVKKYVVFGILFAVLVVPVLADAATSINENLMQNLCNNRGLFDPGCLPLKDKTDLFALLFALLWLVRTIFWILAVVMILFAAYLYLIEGAKTGKVEKANQMLKYAVIAMIIALVATSIPYLVKSILT